MDYGKNFVDLAGPSKPRAAKEEDDWSFDLSRDDNGDHADNLDYNAFQGHR